MSIPAKWHLILSNIFSRVHECDRHTDRHRQMDRPQADTSDAAYESD